MNNIDIEEIREALGEARDECSEVQSKVSDVNTSAGDVKSYADDADTAAYEAEDKVKRAIDLLDGWEEDLDEKINAEAVTLFLRQQRSIILTLSRALLSMDTTITNFAKANGLSVPSLNDEEAEEGGE